MITLSGFHSAKKNYSFNSILTVLASMTSIRMEHFFQRSIPISFTPTYSNHLQTKGNGFYNTNLMRFFWIQNNGLLSIWHCQKLLIIRPNDARTASENSNVYVKTLFRYIWSVVNFDGPPYAQQSMWSKGSAVNTS